MSETRYDKLFKVFSDTFDVTPLNSDIDDFELNLKEQGYKIIDLERVENQQKFAESQMVKADEEGDREEAESWHGYGQALNWILSL